MPVKQILAFELHYKKVDDIHWHLHQWVPCHSDTFADAGVTCTKNETKDPIEVDIANLNEKI
jgi:hypothetical protein